MRKRIPVFIFVFFLVHGILMVQLSGQKGSSHEESGPHYKNDTIEREQYDFLYHLYDSIINASTEDILNGGEYELYYPVYGSNPLIPKHRYPDGSIVIEGIKHSPVVLQYDTYKDMLIYFDPGHYFNNTVVPIILNKYMVDEFVVGLPDNRMRFRYFYFPDTTENIVRSGFYEVGYEGITSYLIKYKTILAITDGEYIFKTRPLKIILNAGGIFRITGRKSLLKALSDKQSQVRKFIRKEKISIRRAGKDEMQRILKYYDTAEIH